MSIHFDTTRIIGWFLVSVNALCAAITHEALPAACSAAACLFIAINFTEAQ